MIVLKSSKKKDYFINETNLFYEKNTEERVKFLKNNQFFYSEISKILKTIINKSDLNFFFCCGNSNIVKEIDSDKIDIQDINEEVLSSFTEKYEKSPEKEINFNQYDNIVIADIEHQLDPLDNLKKLSDKIHDDCNIILISKSLLWSGIIKLIKIF